MTPRHSPLAAKAVLFGHRGAKAHAPDNTIESFLLAYQMGATGLETDSWITKDGIPVLDHDGFVGSLVRRKSIAKLAKAELPSHIPALSELYAALGNVQLPISVDVKDDNAFGPLVECAREAGQEKSLWLCHPDLDTLISWRTKTSAKLICSTRLSKLEGGLERMASKLRSSDVDGLNMHHSDWSPGGITTIHRFGRLALAWDTQFERQIARLIDYGIDAVYSDHVDRMVATASQFEESGGDK